ncbi:MAG: hypothetical protein GOV15_02045 [Candidatus Diapherotrites archaeon]|nr:hypothetical protein [Candidatus Diapherotrites archaeon]
MESSHVVGLLKRPLIQGFISTFGGHNAVELIEQMLLLEHGAVDEVFAEKLNLRVTEIRTLLNRLHYRGLVEYTRTRDEEIGWYTYKWFAKPGNLMDLLEEKVAEELSNAKEKMTLDDNYMMFNCTNNCNEMPFEIAAEYSFRCPDCANEMQTVDKEVEAKKRKAYMDSLSSEMKMLKTISSKN